MTDREQYTPGPASGAQVRKDGEKWTLILVRELRDSERVWQALTHPAHLREWAPFEAGQKPRNVRFFAGFTSSVAFPYSVTFMIRPRILTTTPPALGMSFFLYCSFRGFGCGKAMWFVEFFRGDRRLARRCGNKTTRMKTGQECGV